MSPARDPVAAVKVFDFDGTLVDSNGVWVEVDRRFLAQRGRVPTPEYTEMVSHAIYPTAARFTREYYGLEESAEEIMDCWTALAREAYQHRVPLKPGAAQYLDRCARRGERLALFTAGFPQLCRLALARHGLERYFSHLCFAQDFGLEKRDPRAFAALTARLGVPPEACVLFDDSPRSCLAAKTAGLRVVGVYDPYFAHAQDQLRAACHLCISGFPQLLDGTVPDL